MYDVTFDDMKLDIDVRYKGSVLSRPEIESVDWLQAEDGAFANLAMSRVYYHADDVTVSFKDGTSHYRLHFIH